MGEKEKSKRPAAIAGAILLLLAVPSFFSTDLPLPLISEDTTPINVGCALPSHRRYNHPGRPTFDDFISETRKLVPRTDILLWPESAVHFDSGEEREEAMRRISAQIDNGTYWAVGFEEQVQQDSPDGVWKVGMRRNGLVLLGWEGVVYEYYKRHLVPSKHLVFSPAHVPRFNISLPPPLP